MQYSQTLIAKPKDFIPSVSQIEEFLSSMIAQGVVPDNPTIVLRVPTGKTREYPYVDPLTGKNLIVELKDHKKLESLVKISNVVQALHDYELEVAGVGRPKLPPLAIGFKDSYHVGVTCFVSSKHRSTSDLHEAGIGKRITRYRQLCPEMPNDGFFSNPHTLETITVPDAGCARFWVQFELGKFLVPEFKQSGMELLNPPIVAEAERAFGIAFVQGCYWGE